MLQSQFKKLIAAIRSVLEPLRSELREIKEATNKQEEAIAEATRTRKEEEGEIGAIIAHAINTAADSVPDYEKTQRQKEHNLQWGMFSVTFFGALAATAAASGAFYYAHIANQQLCEMRRTNNLTEQALGKSDNALTQTLSKMQGQIDAARQTLAEVQRQKRLDQRPWLRFREYVASGNGESSFNIEVGKKLQIPIEFTNFGKTAALRVRAIVVIELLPVGTDPHLPTERHLFFEAVGEPGYVPKTAHMVPLPPYDGIENALIYPNDSDHINATWKEFGSDGRTPEDRIVTQKDLTGMVNKTSYLSIWGYAQYTDIFDVQHWTKFCIIPNGYEGFHPRIDKCTRFAAVDHNDDPEISKSLP